MPCIVCGADKEHRKFRYQGTDFFQCVTCGLIRTRPFPTEAEIERHYKAKFESGNYTTLLTNMADYIDVYHSYVDIVKKYSGPLKGKTVLDVGCFTGDFLDLMAQENAVTYGIELQENAFNIANEKHSGRIINCLFEKATFHQRFDIVTLFGIIEHVVNPDELIQMACTWLRPGGLLVIQTPNAGSSFARMMGRYWPPYAPVEHIHYFSENTIQQLLSKYQINTLKVSRHIKRLTLNYIFAMLGNFGPEFQGFFRPVMRVIPQWLAKCRVPSYVGEMIVIAEKAV